MQCVLKKNLQCHSMLTATLFLFFLIYETHSCSHSLSLSILVIHFFMAQINMKSAIVVKYKKKSFLLSIKSTGKCKNVVRVLSYFVHRVKPRSLFKHVILLSESIVSEFT